MSKRYLLNIAVIFAIMAIPVHVYAYTVFEAELLGANTIPQSGSAATGTATFVLNEAQSLSRQVR